MQCRWNRFCDIWREWKKLTGSLSCKGDRHKTDEELKDAVFLSSKKSTPVPEYQSLR
jgi:hypothetical protein